MVTLYLYNCNGKILRCTKVIVNVRSNYCIKVLNKTLYTLCAQNLATLRVGIGRGGAMCNLNLHVCRLLMAGCWLIAG